MSINKTVRVRFAPSPTGHLHIGGLRTALFNWLFARHHGGAFLLRIEDTDVERSTQEYRDSILHSFAWTQLEHDEEIVTQSERIEEHRNVAQQLIDEHKAYRCFCSPEDLVARCQKEIINDFFLTYDGYCRDRVVQKDDETRQHVVRFKLPTDRTEVSFNDLIKGKITISLDQLDDFIILRSGGFPMYNFVVVVDDAFMRITHIIRGEEHIVNTPKQILLNEACGYPLPQFGHLPLILGPSGDKLSKRDGATSVVEYRRDGYIPHALLNYLVRLGWSHGDQEIFSLSDLIEHFSLDTIGKKGAIFDFEKLAWVNSVYLKSMTPEEIIDAIVRDVDHNFLSRCSWDVDTIKQVIVMYRERVRTLKMLVEEILLVHNGTNEHNADDMKKWITPDTKYHLDALIKLFEQQEFFTHASCEVLIKELAAALNVKLVTLLQPIRLALLGKTSGPGVFDLLSIIGKAKTITGLKLLRTSISNMN
ncbi:MAG TPA: glutamate--tRNA ligase [Candidatus Babeliales bacterium]|nr:glutamate--tRNA ligase [Candidatus Babeliales bacterium]